MGEMVLNVSLLLSRMVRSGWGLRLLLYDDGALTVVTVFIYNLYFFIKMNNTLIHINI